MLANFTHLPDPVVKEARSSRLLKPHAVHYRLSGIVSSHSLFTCRRMISPHQRQPPPSETFHDGDLKHASEWKLPKRRDIHLCFHSNYSLLDMNKKTFLFFFFFFFEKINPLQRAVWVCVSKTFKMFVGATAGGV